MPENMTFDTKWLGMLNLSTEGWLGNFFRLFEKPKQQIKIFKIDLRKICVFYLA